MPDPVPFTPLKCPIESSVQEVIKLVTDFAEAGDLTYIAVYLEHPGNLYSMRASHQDDPCRVAGRLMRLAMNSLGFALYHDEEE